jgi:hypothetical protein
MISTLFQLGSGMMLRRTLSFWVLVVLVAVSGPKAAIAEAMDFSNLSYPSYPIDQAIQSCAKNLKRHEYVVLAHSPGGAMMCVYGERGLEKSSRATALKFCNQNRTAAEAKLTKCRVVMESGKIVDRKYYNSQRRDDRSPVDIEIYDGKTNKLSRTTGFLSSGRFVSRTTVEVKLTSSGGAVLCRGVMKWSGFSARFEATCFDKFVFSGPVPKPDGFMMYEGHMVQRLTLKVKQEKSYISIKPRN